MTKTSEIAALRAAVIDAAMRGRRRRRSYKNSHYKPPSKVGEAWTHLYGTARAFVEWATEEKIALAIAGLNERADSQAANIKAVREFADVARRTARTIEDAT